MNETIFVGGLILRSRETRWTIVCCTDEGDRRREDEFLCASKFLARYSGNRVQPVFLGLSLQLDGQMEPVAVVNALKPYAVGYDIVLTHNSKGQYGHEHHKLVHGCVIKTICNPNTWVFVSPGSKNVNQEELKSGIPGGNASLDLSHEILRLKKEAFGKCHVSQALVYGYDPVSNELRSTDLKETLSWYFENPGREEFAFFG